MSQVNNPFSKLESKKPFSLTSAEKYREKLEEVLNLDISSEEKFLEFFNAKDELDKLFTNEACETYFLKTIDTANSEYKDASEFFDQKITPIYEEYNEKFNTKIINSSMLRTLGSKGEILERNIKNELDIFNKDNIELEKEINKISSEITEIQGKLTGRWEDEDLPLPMIYPFQKSTDRLVRKKAYDLIDEVSLSVFEDIDTRFDKLLALRNQVAKNAGYENYIDYRFKEMKRFDWGKTDCYEFHQAIKKYIVPLSVKIASKKKENLKLDSYTYYDTGVDFFGREPLMIYDKDNIQPFIDGAGKIIESIDSELFDYFKKIRDNKLLDLDARKNKAPGGYMCMYPTYELASIFYGGSGLSHDLLVLLHELGHCFHYFLGKDVTPYSLQDWTSEVAEGGSMSMEYIGIENMNQYLDTESCNRVKSGKLLSVIGLFISCSMGDEFQHWIYENPGHSSQDRQSKYIELLKEYYSAVDYCGKEDICGKIDWQYMHILQAPFYLIDYSISELLALTVWDRYKTDPKEGLDYYKKGCSLAASKSVPEIYNAFGTSLDFSEKVIAPLASRLETELNL